LESGFRLGRFFGIQFRVDFSWFIIFALLTFFLAADVFPGAVKGQSVLVYWVMGATTSLLFFVSVLLHETGHSLIARGSGIPVGGITLFLFGGAAQMNREPPTAASELKMAFAGPGVSLLLAAFFWVVYTFFLGGLNTVAAMALWLSQINLIVAVFNLLPGFPLDGGRVLRGVWWRLSGDYVRATRVAVFFGRVAGALIIVAGLFVALQYRDRLAGIWLAILGWYLESSARLSLRQFTLQQWMKGKKVAEVMERDCVPVDGGISIDAAKKMYPDKRCFLAITDGKTEKALFMPVVGNRPGTTLLVDLAIPLDAAIEVAPGDDLLLLAQKMNEKGKDVARVVVGGSVAGVVFLDSLIELVNREMPPKNSSRRT